MNIEIIENHSGKSEWFFYLPLGENSTLVYSGDYLMKFGLEIRAGRGDLSSNVYEISEVK